MPQILPSYSEVIVLSDEVLNSCDYYASIYEYERRKKICWLIDEKNSLWDFIETLGEQDRESNNEAPMNFYDFHAAYNIKFPAGTVRLINELCISDYDLRDISELLRALILRNERFFQHAVFLKAGQLSRNELLELRRKILQQFIYLRIYLPVIIADNYVSADCEFREILYLRRTKNFRLAIIGTKKAGKSTLINAMLGSEYSPSSSELPTPCVLIYAKGSKSGKIRFVQSKQVRFFKRAEDLNKFLVKKFREANKKSKSLSKIKIALPDYPENFRRIKIYDTPGPNLAGVLGHEKAALSAIKSCEACLFVMNYSVHLTDNELELFDIVCGAFDEVIIALNKIDEMFSSEVVKSYERAADYIASRLAGLGRKNFLIVPVSALTSFYASSQNLFIKILRHSFENFYGINLSSPDEIEHAGRIKYLMHLINQLNK